MRTNQGPLTIASTHARQWNEKPIYRRRKRRNGQERKLPGRGWEGTSGENIKDKKHGGQQDRVIGDLACRRLKHTRTEDGQNREEHGSRAKGGTIQKARDGVSSVSWQEGSSKEQKSTAS